MNRIIIVQVCDATVTPRSTEADNIKKIPKKEWLYKKFY
jgi:hypothetical protein